VFWQVPVIIVIQALINQVQAEHCAWLVRFHSTKYSQGVVSVIILHVLQDHTKDLPTFPRAKHVMLAIIRPHQFLLTVQDVLMGHIKKNVG
jgi:hypothetical protein